MKKIMTITIVSIVIVLGIAIGLLAYKRILPMGLGIHKPVYHIGNMALDGYDVTSYFDDHLEKGNSAFSTTHLGVTWQFSSKERLEAFMSNPERFTPQFGGYCTKAVGSGFAAPSDLTVYTVHDDKLFIFSSQEVKNSFLDDPNNMIKACEKKWK